MRSGFFNSEIVGYDAENMPVFDRAEEASFFAKYFSMFISNGVFPNPSTNMQVLADEGMQVKVGIGVCYINGYMGWVESAEILEIEESDVQARIDRIVARLDFMDRSIKLFVKKGVPAGNPVAPELQRDYDVYEIGLADVRLNANVVEITQANITDLRLNTEVCGVVANQLQHVDTTTLFNQYQDWLRSVIAEAESDIGEKKTQFEVNLQGLENEFTASFNEWFQDVQYILDGDVAGKLINLIETTKASLMGTKADKKKNWTLNVGTNWNGERAPYTQMIDVSGLCETDIVNIYPIWDDDLETRITERKEYNKISLVKSAENSIELVCDEEKTEIVLNVRLEVLY